MSALNPKRWRLRLSSRTPGVGLVDVLTAEPPALWQGNALRIEFAVSNPPDDTLVTDFTDYDQFICELWQSQTNGTLLAPQKLLEAVDIGNELTEAQWAAGEAYQGAFEFTAAELSLVFTQRSRTAWLVIVAVADAGERVTLGAGMVGIWHDRALGGGDAPEPPELYYTRAQIDAMFFGGGFSTGTGPRVLANFADLATAPVGSRYYALPHRYQRTPWGIAVRTYDTEFDVPGAPPAAPASVGAIPIPNEVGAYTDLAFAFDGAEYFQRPDSYLRTPTGNVKCYWLTEPSAPSVLSNGAGVGLLLPTIVASYALLAGTPVGSLFFHRPHIYEMTPWGRARETPDTEFDLPTP